MNASDDQGEWWTALSSLGLTAQQVEAYRFLVDAGGATATNVAKAVGLPRGRIYDTLRTLVERGLVLERVGRPIRYEPVPPGTVLRLAQERVQAVLRAIEEARRHIPEAGAAAGEPLISRGDVALLVGRRALMAEIERVFAQADGWLLVWGPAKLHEHLARSKRAVESLRLAAARGVSVELVIHGPPLDVMATAGLCRLVFPFAHIHERATGSSPLACILESCRTLLVLLQPPDFNRTKGEDQALRVRGSTFSRTLVAWLRPPPHATPVTFPVQDRLGVGPRLLELLPRVKREIRGLGPAGWTRFLQEGIGALREGFEAARTQGVRLRGLTEDDPAERAILEEFAKAWEVRVHPNLPGWTLILDDEHLFQAWPLRSETGPQQLRHTTNPDEIQTATQRFERLWAQGVPFPPPPEPEPRRAPAADPRGPRSQG